MEYTLNKRVYFFIKFVLYIVFRIFFRIKISGKENINSVKSSFILASNHQSYLDPIVLAFCTERHLRFMARESLFRHYIFRKFILKVGALPVNLQKPKISFIKNFCNVLNSGEVLVIFPEGTRGSQAVVKKPQSGIGYLMSKLNVPAVPVFIENTGKVLPKSSWAIRFYQVKVNIGRPVRLKDLKHKLNKGISAAEKYQLIADHVMQKIKQAKH